MEPSAGTGNFVQSLLNNFVSKKQIKAIDVDPKHQSVLKMDYLTTKFRFSSKRVVIGNPPFGKRGSMALEFLNKALSEALLVAMIFPNTFNRYMIQKKVKNNCKLIYSESLDEKSFILNDREYGVKCVFQIWVSPKFHTFETDKRIKIAPENKHEDFVTYIHNNTENTLKYFDKNKYKWEFAIVRQGYYNYSEKITNPKKLIKNRQYFFIKPINEEAKNIINLINFEKLALSNTQVLGFSTTDFVQEYKKMKTLKRNEKNA